ncbi:MAG: restriction endonuclease subunit S, partial [Pseudanabaena sp.]
SDDSPMGWVKTELGEIFEFNPRHSSAIDKSMDVSFIPMPSVCEHNGIILPHNTKKLEEVWKGYTHFQNDDVIFAKITPCMENGKIALASNLHNDIACGSTEFHVLRSIGVVLPLYIWYFLRQKSFLRDAEQRMTGAVGQRRVPVNFLKETNLAIPPLNEQRRIVDKLDRIGDRQRSARNELSHIPKLIARYKQAVLAAACSGKLTEDFRLSNSLSISSISLSEVCNSISDGDHQAPPRSETGIPFITISAINDGSLSLNKATRFVPKSYFESLSKIRKPEIDDILFTVTGSIGIPVIVDTDEPFVFQRHIAILKANKNIILAKYLLYALGSDQIQKQALNVATGTAQLTIPLGGLRNFQIQLPSLEEQKEIVRRVEKMFAKIDKMEEEYQKAAKLCDRLEQATLAKAFRGELVPQDPNDEPASVLLEQVKKEKEKGKKGVKSK